MKTILFFGLAIFGSFSSKCQVFQTGDSSSLKKYFNHQFNQGLLSKSKSPGQYLKEQNQLSHTVMGINEPVKMNYNIDGYLNQLKYSQTVHMMLSHLHPLASERMIRSQSDFPLLFGN